MNQPGMNQSGANGNPEQRRTVIITGGAGGIGRATAVAFLSQQANVVIADLNAARGKQVEQSLGEEFSPGHVKFQQCDVSRERDMIRLVRTTVQHFGRLDVMVNNAGIGGAFGKLIDIREEDWNRTMQIVLGGVFLGTKHAARAMIQQQSGGAIINVASIAALVSGAGGVAYSAAKGAVLSLTRIACRELSPHRIRVNSVLPGCIMTPLCHRGEEEQVAELAARAQPWPEAGRPEDVAATIAFLASDAARFIGGADFVIDGGALAKGPFRDDDPHVKLVHDLQSRKVTTFDYGDLATANTDTVSTVDETVTDSPRTVVITGVSRGLGRAMADEFIRRGHRVIGCARSSIDELRSAYGAPHEFRQVDIGSAEDVARWAEEIHALGVIPDLLINNAAITHDGKPTWKFTPEEFENVMRVNVLGVANIVREFVPDMLRRKTGVIVNFSSGWGRETAPRTAAYVASKWGVEGMTRSLAAEILPTMAAVTLHPGIVQTDGMKKTFGKAAELYPTPEQWALTAVPFLLEISPADNGEPLSVPGMTDFKGIGNIVSDDVEQLVKQYLKNRP